MPARTRVSRRVVVRGAVATERGAAFLTGPQVNPSTADLHAFVALSAFRVFDILDGLEMRAG